MTEKPESYTNNGKKMVEIPEILLKELYRTNYNHEMKALNEDIVQDRVLYMQKELEYISPYIVMTEKNGKKRIDYDHVSQAVDIIHELKLIYNKFGMFYYNPNTGLWCSDAQSKLKQVITWKLGRFLTTKYLNETLTVINRIYDSNIQSLPFDNNPYLIGFKNGVYDMRKKMFRNYQATDMLTSSLPHEYNEEADNPETERYLDDLLGEKKQFFYEWIGYSLFKDYNFQHLLILVGNGRNGKSLLLDWYKHLIGTRNVSHISLRELQESKFAQGQLLGKYANIFSDIGDDYFKFSDIIKVLTGNDTITVDRKNASHVTFKNHAKLSFSANKLPRFKDRSEGLLRRVILLPMYKQIEKNSTNPLDLLLQKHEVEATLIKAMEAFQEVLKRKEFSLTQDMIEEKEQWVNEQNNVKMFITECCVVGGEHKVKLEWLYPKYQEFCHANDYKTLRERDFKAEVLRSYPGITYKQKGKNDRQRYFYGLHYPI